MPTSSIWGKSQTVEWIRTHDAEIDRILDIGVGAGTYFNLLSRDNGLAKNAEWVGVEVWEPYIQKFDLTSKYNKIINQDVRTINWKELGHFSIAFAGDVLEHMTKEESICLVNNILDCTNTLIISIPIIYYPQGEYDGNPYEEHIKPDWSHTEMLDTWHNLITHHWVDLKNADVGVYWLQKRV
jgi:predicted TPR repeat methyltransferase